MRGHQPQSSLRNSRRDQRLWDRRPEPAPRRRCWRRESCPAGHLACRANLAERQIPEPAKLAERRIPGPETATEAEISLRSTVRNQWHKKWQPRRTFARSLSRALHHLVEAGTEIVHKVTPEPAQPSTP